MGVSCEAVTAAKDLLTVMVVEELARSRGIGTGQALLEFMESRVYSALYGDEEAKLWWDGPASILELYEKELRRFGR